MRKKTKKDQTAIDKRALAELSGDVQPTKGQRNIMNKAYSPPATTSMRDLLQSKINSGEIRTVRG